MGAAAHIEPLSIVYGPPLAEEKGVGALTIGGYLREVVRRHAGREALVMRVGDSRVSWTYDQLWAQALEVARALIAVGVGKDSRVGLLMTNRPEHLASIFGISLAGGVVVELSTFSTPAELDYLLQTSAASMVLYDRQVLKKDFGAMLAELEPQILTAAPGGVGSARYPFLKRLVALDSVTGGGGAAAPDGKAVQGWGEFLAAGRGVDPAVVEARAASVRPSDIGALFFSSGTTSLPKGILHAQRAIALQWWRWPEVMDIDPVNHPVRCWTGNGFFWSGNISMVVGNALSSGGTMVLQPIFQAEEALEIMEKERVSYPIGRPHQWARLEESPRWDSTDLSSLHYITYAEKLFAHPTVKTDWRIRPAYGATETLTIMTAVKANAPEADHRGSYGPPLAGNIIKVFEPITRQVVARGQRGEIAIKGPTLMLGYVGKTLEETFDEEGYFCTGDGGYVDDRGLLFWEGRLTDIIKTGGANVSPLEVDAVLAAYPGVKRVQTVGVPHETLSEMVVSCIVPHDDAALEAEVIRDFLKERLASFKIPRVVLFFREEEFAVTGSEKVKTSALRELAAARIGDAAPAA